MEDRPGDRLDPYAAAFDRTHARLWRALFAYAADPEIASDAAAEAYAQAMRRGSAIRDIDAWVWRAAFRIASGELARRRERGASLDDGGPDLTVDGPEPALDLIAALRRVSDRQRSVLVLHYVGGYTAVDIAKRLGTSAGSVRVSLLRGRRALRALLEDTDG